MEDEPSLLPAMQRVLPQFELVLIEKASELLPTLRLLKGVAGVISDSIALHLAQKVKEEFAIPFVIYSAGHPREAPGVDEWIQKPDPLFAKKISERIKA